MMRTRFHNPLVPALLCVMLIVAASGDLRADEPNEYRITAELFEFTPNRGDKPHRFPKVLDVAELSETELDGKLDKLRQAGRLKPLGAPSVLAAVGETSVIPFATTTANYKLSFKVKAHQKDSVLVDLVLRSEPRPRRRETPEFDAEAKPGFAEELSIGHTVGKTLLLFNPFGNAKPEATARQLLVAVKTSPSDEPASEPALRERGENKAVPLERLQRPFLKLQLGEARTVQLKQKVETIRSDDEKVVEISPLSPTRIMVRGRAGGSTNVAIVTDDGRVQSLTVLVNVGRRPAAANRDRDRNRPAVRPLPERRPQPERRRPPERKPRERRPTLREEVRELRKEVDELRVDVRRLLDLLRGKAPLQPADDAGDPAEANDEAERDAGNAEVAPEAAVSVWSRLGMRLGAKLDAAEVGSNYRGGLRIDAVRKGGPAEAAGIKPQDIIVGIHHWETTSHKNVDFALRRLEDGTKVKVYIRRGDNTLYAKVQLKTQPSGPSASFETNSMHKLLSAWRVSLDDVVSIARANHRGDSPESPESRINAVKSAYRELSSKQREVEDRRKRVADILKQWRELQEANVTINADTALRGSYFDARAEQEDALASMHQSESHLRELLGLAATDGRLLTPSD